MKKSKTDSEKESWRDELIRKGEDHPCLVTLHQIFPEEKTFRGTEFSHQHPGPETGYHVDSYTSACNYLGITHEKTGNGFIASMPLIISTKIKSPFNYEDGSIWKRKMATMSEEIVFFDEKGKICVLAINGGGNIGYLRGIRYKFGVFTTHSAPFTYGIVGAQRLKNFLIGRGSDKKCCPIGKEFPVFKFNEFKKGISNLPRRYGVLLRDDEFLSSDNMLIVRSGHPDIANVYKKKIINTDEKDYVRNEVINSHKHFEEFKKTREPWWVLLETKLAMIYYHGGYTKPAFIAVKDSVQSL